MVVILQPVINRLKELFPDIRIEIDRQKQGVKAPCFFICDFSQLSTQRVRNKKLPAMRVGNNRLYQKITFVL